jgi:hypothetical protein
MDEMDEDQLDAMYALAGCNNVNYKLSAVTQQVGACLVRCTVKPLYPGPLERLNPKPCQQQRKRATHSRD